MYNTHNGFLIHTRDYRETSSILNIFTSQGGIESLVFKGKHTNKDLSLIHISEPTRPC